MCGRRLGVSGAALDTLARDRHGAKTRSYGEFLSRIATATHRASRDRRTRGMRCAVWSSLFLLINGWVRYYFLYGQVCGCWNNLHSRPIGKQDRTVLFA